MRRRSFSSSIFSRVISHSAWNGFCYALAQGINFLVQLTITAQLGKVAFGEIGVAQLYVLSATFIAELGLPNYFIREASQDKHWQRQWRHAVLVRALFLTTVAVGMLIWSGMPLLGQHIPLYIAAAIPGMIASAWNPTPLLIAQGRSRAAGIGLVLQWGIYSIAAVLALIFSKVLYVSLILGGAFSLGALVAMLYLTKAVEWPKPDGQESPFRVAMWRSAVTVWIPGLVGTLYLLLLTFLIRRLAPELLAFFLLGNQFMQGLNGLNMQLQRVLLATLAKERHRSASELFPALLSLSSKLAVGLVMAIFAAILLCVCVLHLINVAAVDLSYVALILVEWIMTLIGSFLVTQLTAQHGERTIYRITVYSYTVSAAAQLLIAELGGGLLLVLLIRIVIAVLQIFLFHRALRLSFSPVLLAGTAGLIVAGWLPFSPEITVTMLALTMCLCLAASWRNFRLLA